MEGSRAMHIGILQGVLFIESDRFEFNEGIEISLVFFQSNLNDTCNANLPSQYPTSYSSETSWIKMYVLANGWEKQPM